MSKIHAVIKELHRLDEMAGRDIWINKIHPVAKLIVTLVYLIVLMSFGWNQVTSLLTMSLYLIIILVLGDFSLLKIIRRLWFVFLAITIFAFLNPLFDTRIYATVGEYAVSVGMVSAITLTIKGYFSLIAVSILGESTTMNDICYALKCLHFPKLFVTMIALINRYVMMLLQETSRTTNAYSLRSYSGDGIKSKAWGSLLGNIILRSIDRAERIYESMMLRGFNGTFYYSCKDDSARKSFAYAVCFSLSFIVLRFVPIFEIIGEFLCNL